MDGSRIISHVIGAKRDWPMQLSKPVYEPCTGKQFGQVMLADDAICAEAIIVADTAFQSWSKTPFLKRLKPLFAFRQMLLERQDSLASVISREHGKTHADAKGSIARSIELIEYHCGLMQQVQTSFSFDVAQDVDCLTVRSPLGVCVGISPFNFPVMVSIWMMIPAIVYGNTFILKPSEQTPSAPNLLVEWLLEAGIPEGVVNCVHGDQKTVECLIQHPSVKAVTAVASTPVAEAIYQQAMYHGKRAHTFGGAKNHALIMPDADLNEAAEAIIGAAFGSAGERCMALSVVMVTEAQVGKKMRSLLAEKMQAIRMDVEDPADMDMGPLISLAHRDRVLNYVQQGVDEGADLVVDGRLFQHSKWPNGYFLGPCFFDQVSPSMRIYQEEIFGPVLCMMHVSDFDEAISLVNQHSYGNGTAIFTASGYFAREYAKRVHIGMVGVNVPIPMPIASHPFGGWKRSSFGDIGLHGQESLIFYTQQKSITTRWQASMSTVAAFSMPTHEE